MAAIATTFGTGGSHLTPGNSSGSPSLATVLRDVALDLADLKGAAPTANVAAAALGAFTDPPSAVEMAAVRTLVNELRAVVVENRAVRVTQSGLTLRTTAP